MGEDNDAFSRLNAPKKRSERRRLTRDDKKEPGRLQK
jgi:hypothetical protein